MLIPTGLLVKVLQIASGGSFKGYDFEHQYEMKNEEHLHRGSSREIYWQPAADIHGIDRFCVTWPVPIVA